jgi:hypothetical protein
MWTIKPVEKTKEVDGLYTAVATWHDDEFGDFVIGYKVNETEESQKKFALYIEKYRDEWLAKKKAEKEAEMVKLREITDLVAAALNTPLVK